MIVKSLVNDLNLLTSQGVNVRGKTFVGSLSFISGDNLGSNMIGGFVESFSTKVNYYCRTCLSPQTEIQNVFSDENSLLRTPENYDQHVTELLSDTTRDTLYGIKQNSPFNSSFFHVTQGLPPDIAHDLLEGVVPFEINLVLTSLVTAKVISIDYLYNQIETWSYGPLDIIDRPALIAKKCKISQTAARMWTLLRLLPLMCAAIIPEDNFHWKFLIDLKEIVEIVFAPVLSIDYIAYLRIRINDHLQLFKELYPEKVITPKQHFLIHYPLHLLRFGPLRNCWTLRFEAKHYYFKKLAIICKNYKNITKTLANRHQFHQAYQGTHLNGYLQSNKTVGLVNSLELASIEPKSAQNVVKQKGLIGELFSVSFFSINSLKYICGLFIVRELVNEEPIFSKIRLIITNNKKVYFLLEDYVSSYYQHYGSYNVTKKYGEGDFYLVETNNLPFLYPLSSYYTNGNWYISLKYVLVSKETC